MCLQNLDKFIVVYKEINETCPIVLILGDDLRLFNRSVQ